MQTERLTLRLPTLEDVAVVGPLLTDPEVVRFLGGEIVPPEAHAEVVQKWIERWDIYGVGAFMVEHDGVFVGRTGILIWDRRTWTHRGPKPPVEFQQPEIGWAFVRAAWGNGYATEAARAVIDWAQTERGIENLISLIAPANIRSQRVAERLGATPGETITHGDEPVDSVVWRYQEGLAK